MYTYKELVDFENLKEYAEENLLENGFLKDIYESKTVYSFTIKKSIKLDGLESFKESKMILTNEEKKILRENFLREPKHINGCDVLQWYGIYNNIITISYKILVIFIEDPCDIFYYSCQKEMDLIKERGLWFVISKKANKEVHRNKVANAEKEKHITELFKSSDQSLGTMLVKRSKVLHKLFGKEGIKIPSKEEYKEVFERETKDVIDQLILFIPKHIKSIEKALEEKILLEKEYITLIIPELNNINKNRSDKISNIRKVINFIRNDYK